MNSKPLDGRSEPAGMTITDMVVLVLGCAVALSLPKLGLVAPFPFSNCFGPPTPDPPAWAMRFGTITELALKLTLAIALVALGRCWRWDRVPRPAEWLAILTGIHLLDLIEREPYRLLIDSTQEYRFRLANPDAHPDLWMLIVSHDMWCVPLGTAIGLAGLTPIALYRESLSARLKTILVVVAAYALVTGPLTRTWAAIYDVLGHLHPHRHRSDPMEWLWKGPSSVCSMVPGVIFGIAAFVTLRSWRDSRSRRWIDQALFIALVPFALYSASRWFPDVLSDHPLHRESILGRSHRPDRPIDFGGPS